MPAGALVMTVHERIRALRRALDATGDPNPDPRLSARAASVRALLDPASVEARAEVERRLAEERWARRAIREGEAEQAYGHSRGAFPCESCRRFKSSPAAVCGYCGDDPVGTAGGSPDAVDRMNHNRAHGWAH